MYTVKLLLMQKMQMTYKMVWRELLSVTAMLRTTSTEPGTTDINAVVQSLRESYKWRVEEENDIVTEERRVKTYLDAVTSSKELQWSAVQHNDSDMLSAISQAKVFVESQAANWIICVQKPLLDFW
jgi:hypothetical protein